ncbi:MAG: hypothetical protein ACD_18C00100G0005 [uncultured bacterium]|nr:MAG: hypothetical protein ACD_18C00100G0005 [uncultured bacterium]HAO52762.1 hypothetical protein [Candidatus Magasanikbacteria bacterium]
MEGNKNKYVVNNKNLLYPELSFEINGILFDVFKQIGGGHLEKYYQKAVALGLKNKNINFKEQYYVPLKYENEIVGKYFLDFLIEDKIVIELKRGQFVPANIINQTKQYLVSLNLELALIACFTHKGVFIKRIINQL